jgi:thiol-disulfide isomerase/thioredoxin
MRRRVNSGRAERSTLFASGSTTPNTATPLHFGAQNPSSNVELSTGTLLSRPDRAWLALLCVAAGAGSCKAAPERTPPPQATPDAAATRSGPRPEFVPAPRSGPGELERFVSAEVARGNLESRRVLVYVGAPWCEPCRRFHAAVDSGALDAQLAGLRFVEFDVERDGAALHAAGYDFRLIPVIALPNTDGRSSGHFLSGSIKGSGAVANIVPRLEALLAGRPVD